ncbi:MAG: hypothetical protein WC795_00045 [Candidatus Paceibacterota bacterium]|jgi:D-alanine-D-alanine ligase
MEISMPKIRVGVLRGGISPEYDVSLQTGGTILEHLVGELSDKYKPVDLLITKDGLWHMNGAPVSIEKIHQNVDVVWNALHGTYGEDGRAVAILRKFGIPYTGSDGMPAVSALHKGLAKEFFLMHGIKTPLHETAIAPIGEFSDWEIHDIARAKAREIFAKIPPSWVIKSLKGGSPLGIIIAKTFTELEDTLFTLFKNKKDLIVEEFIEGRQITSGVIEHYRGQRHYALLPQDLSGEGVISKFSSGEREEIENLAQKIHQAFGLRHYSRSKFIIHPRKGIYTIETKALPEITGNTAISHSLESVGATLHHFIDHVIKLALDKK